MKRGTVVLLNRCHVIDCFSNLICFNANELRLVVVVVVVVVVESESDCVYNYLMMIDIIIVIGII